MDERETTGARLRRLRQERELSLRALGKLADLSHGTIGKIEAGRVVSGGPKRGSKAPGDGTLRKLERALGVPLGTLGEGAALAPDLSPMERGPAPRYFGVVQQYANVEPSGWITQYIPVARQRMKEWMGPLEMEQPIPLAVPKLGHYRAIRVVGESMETECSPGDLAIVDCDAIARVGQAIVVEVGGEEVLRYLAEQTSDRVVLAAENSDMPDIVVSPAEAEIVGVIVAYQRLPKEFRRPVRRVG